MRQGARKKECSQEKENCAQEEEASTGAWRRGRCCCDQWWPRGQDGGQHGGSLHKTMMAVNKCHLDIWTPNCIFFQKIQICPTFQWYARHCIVDNHITFVSFQNPYEFNPLKFSLTWPFSRHMASRCSVEILPPASGPHMSNTGRSCA